MDLNHLKFFYKKNLFTQIILLFISVLIKMVPEAGFEPARLEGQGILSPSRLPIPSLGHIIGDPSEIRTPDTVIKSHVLYLLS